MAGTIIGGVVGGFLGTEAADKMVDYIATHPTKAELDNFNKTNFGGVPYQYPG